MKKLFLVILCLCIIVTSGCSSANIHTREKPPLSLNIAASFRSDIAAQTYQTLSNTYSSRYGIQILDTSALSEDAYTQQIINDFAAGNEPDVFYYPLNAAQTMIDNRQVVSLTEIRRRYPQYATTVENGILEQMADPSGNNWCVPVIGSYQALYCNTELFKIYGAPLPYTWADFMAAIDAFRQYNVTPVAAGFLDNTYLWFDHLILAHGTKEHDAIPTEREDIPITWNQALVQLPHLNKRGAFPSNATSLSHANAQQLFSTGKTPMILDSSDNLTLLGSNDSVIAMSVPCRAPSSGEQHLIVDFSSGFFISRKAWENDSLRDAAVQFVMYMSSPEAVSKLVTEGAGYPAIARARLSTVISDDPLAQSVLNLVSTSQLHSSISRRISRRAWLSLGSSAAQLCQGYSNVDRVLDDMIKNNGNLS